MKEHYDVPDDVKPGDILYIMWPLAGDCLLEVIGDDPNLLSENKDSNYLLAKCFFGKRKGDMFAVKRHQRETPVTVIRKNDE